MLKLSNLGNSDNLKLSINNEHFIQRYNKKQDITLFNAR